MSGPAPDGLDDFLATSQAPSPPAGAMDQSAPAGLDAFIAPELQQAKYGGLGQQAIAGVEGAARGASLGTSDILARQMFGAEAVKGRQEANPVTSTVWTMLGGAGLIAATGGIAAPIEAGLGGGFAAAAAGYGAEGAAFGAGNAVSDAALGDPSLNAQKVLAHIGMGAAIGTGLGVLSKGVGLARTLLRGTPAEAAGDAGTGAIANGTSGPVIDAPTTGKPVTSLDEMDAKVEQIKKSGKDMLQLPQKAIAEDAHSRIGPEMQIPITGMQMDSLGSQTARNEFTTMLEVPGKNGDTLRNVQGIQKTDLVNILDKTINNDIAPGYTPTTDAAEAGERASQAFTDVIDGTRKELGPAFEQIKSTPLNDEYHTLGVLDYLTNKNASQYANPSIANMFETGTDGIAIKSYKTSMGIDNATYRAVKQAVEALEDNPYKSDFKKLVDIRKGLSQNVDVMAQGDASKEIGGAKAAFMDYIQNAVQTHDPDLAVRETFKNWAKNEEAAQFIEKKFGAEIGSGNFRSLAKGKADEGILNKIFTDSEAVKAVKSILPPEKFNELLADHLAILKNDMTDNGVFSSMKFYSKMNQGNHKYALNEAFGENAAPYQKIKDTIALSRIFPDARSINPSGTTKTFLQSILQGGLDPFAHVKNLGEYAKDQFSQAAMARQINAKLAGVSDSVNKLNSVQGILGKVNGQIQSGAKSLFNSGAPRGGALSAAAQLSNDEYDKITKRLGDFSSNPQSLLDHVSDNTQHLYQAAPHITQAIHTSMMQGVQFLNSKLPKPPSAPMPMSAKWEPSKAQKAQFNQYYQGVNNPIGAFQQVKDGTLSNNQMESLQAIHPQLLQEMRSKTLEHMGNLDKAKALPYSQKLTLAKWLGQPLDENMTTLGVQGNQMAMQSPQRSQQTSSALAGKMKDMDLAGRSATTTQRTDQS